MNELAVYNDVVTEEKKYIAFKIGDENFAIDIFSINTIIELPQITSMPGAEAHYRGIIYLRGEVIPVLSLRRMMGLEDDVFTRSTKIVVVTLEKNKQVGIIVDQVMDVISVADEEIKESSAFLKGCEYLVSGVGKIDGELYSMVNLAFLA